ncbi:hypothetical protein O7627_00870 [Solwaraspora sp. WMMD1047]|jgi:NADH:ubiquinone oxidoreductase subunit H|uniref:hypothetical protein n=1 Tax=Solwaraspora sp. WMMD1047 TaxID=3016102 RepID=UPI002415C07F|nr:hypothetical protein [Solwaraspora sp. WMMD1047]MDG4827851.1 hypothetical protein [Solwaraspora sp. WMMD1047]
MVRKQIARWAVMAVAVPVAAAGARKVSQKMESRRGPSRTSGLLRKGADMLHGNRKRRPAWRR